jgi:Predicted Zn-dependent protease
MNYMTLGYENIFTILLFLAGIIVVSYAQNKISSAYKKYKNTKIKKIISGVEVARKILDENGLNDIHVVKINGELTDHYDSSRKVVRLSNHIFNEETIASVAVAAHECGHALQDKDGYTFMKIRSFLVPVVNFVTYIGYAVSIVSLLSGITGYLMVGIIMIIAAIIFQLITLPVEFDASKRALIELEKLNIIEKNEIEETKAMLDAAAFTYVASLISSILNLFRLLIMYKGRDD